MRASQNGNVYRRPFQDENSQFNFAIQDKEKFEVFNILVQFQVFRKRSDENSQILS